MQNQNQTPNKSSKIEKLTNKFIFIMLFLEILMAATCTFGITIWQLFEGILFFKKTGSTFKNWYLLYYYPHNDFTILDLLFSSFKGLLTYIILFNNIIPISLYVTMEVASIVIINHYRVYSSNIYIL
jgi:phospholipid-transporting ATPase